MEGKEGGKKGGTWREGKKIILTILILLLDSFSITGACHMSKAHPLSLFCVPAPKNASISGLRISLR